MLNCNKGPHNNKKMAIVTRQDLLSPWQSVHAFPTVAGRLAAMDSLRLICREDERTECLDRLNDLMQAPTVRRRAHAMLVDWEAQTAACLERLIATEMTPLVETEVAGLLEEIEESLAHPPSQPSVFERFRCSVEPAYPTQEITGLSRQLAQLRRFNAGLEMWSAGQQIESYPGQRQRLGAGEPASYHLTLWQYKVVAQKSSLRPSPCTTYFKGE